MEVFADFFFHLSSIMYLVTQSTIFNQIILFFICVAAIMVGVQSYDSLEYNRGVLVVDWIILVVFTFEVVAKILSEGKKPWRYFTGPERNWNIFDFMILLFCMPFIPVNTNSIAFLRLMRLFRVAKLFKHIPELNVIVIGMLFGMESILYIMILLFIVFYLFAVMAVFLFRDNDPGNFGDLGITIVSLFRCATLEDWTDMMYINIFGCNIYDGGLYFPANSTHTFPTRFGTYHSFTCVSPNPTGAVATMYFVIFTIVSAFVILSLFIGAITLAMSEVLDEAYRDRKRAKIAEVVSPQWLWETVGKALDERRIMPSDLKGGSLFGESPHRNKGKFQIESGSNSPPKRSPNGKRNSTEEGKNSPQKRSPQTRRSSLSRNRTSSTEDEKPAGLLRSSTRKLREKKEFVSSVEEGFNKEGRSRVSTFRSSQGEGHDSTPKIRPMGSVSGMIAGPGPGGCRGLEKQQSFRRPDFLKHHSRKKLERGISLTDLRLEKSKSQRNLLKRSSTRNLMERINRQPQQSFKETVYLLYLRWSLGCRRVAHSPKFEVFMMSTICLAGLVVGLSTVINTQAISITDNIILGIFTIELVVKFFAEGRKPWRYFLDPWNKFDFMVVFCSYLPMLPIFNKGTASSMGSAVNSFRLMRVLRVLKLVQAFRVLKIVMEAIFKGFQSMIYISLMMFVLFYMFAIIGMILFKENDPWHFGLLQDALITLFRCATLEDWTDVMYINMWGCDRYGYDNYPELCTSPVPWGWLAAVFFIVFALVGSLVLVTLFLGVVSTGMETAALRYMQEDASQEEMNAALKRHHITDAGVRLLYNAYSLLDEDDSGKLTYDELLPLLSAVSSQFTEGILKEMYAEVDIDDSGDIDFAEFMNLMVLIKRWAINKAEEEERAGKKTYDKEGFLSPNRTTVLRSPFNPHHGTERRKALPNSGSAELQLVLTSVKRDIDDVSSPKTAKGNKTFREKIERAKTETDLRNKMKKGLSQKDLRERMKKTNTKSDVRRELKKEKTQGDLRTGSKGAETSGSGVNSPGRDRAKTSYSENELGGPISQTWRKRTKTYEESEQKQRAEERAKTLYVAKGAKTRANKNQQENRASKFRLTGTRSSLRKNNKKQGNSIQKKHSENKKSRESTGDSQKPLAERMFGRLSRAATNSEVSPTEGELNKRISSLCSGNKKDRQLKVPKQNILRVPSLSQKESREHLVSTQASNTSGPSSSQDNLLLTPGKFMADDLSFIKEESTDQSTLRQSLSRPNARSQIPSSSKQNKNSSHLTIEESEPSALKLEHQALKIVGFEFSNANPVANKNPRLIFNTADDATKLQQFKLPQVEDSLNVLDFHHENFPLVTKQPQPQTSAPQPQKEGLPSLISVKSEVSTFKDSQGGNTPRGPIVDSVTRQPHLHSPKLQPRGSFNLMSVESELLPQRLPLKNSQSLMTRADGTHLTDGSQILTSPRSLTGNASLSRSSVEMEIPLRSSPNLSHRLSFESLPSMKQTSTHSSQRQQRPNNGGLPSSKLTRPLTPPLLPSDRERRLAVARKMAPGDSMTLQQRRRPVLKSSKKNAKDSFKATQMALNNSAVESHMRNNAVIKEGDLSDVCESFKATQLALNKSVEPHMRSNAATKEEDLLRSAITELNLRNNNKLERGSLRTLSEGSSVGSSHSYLSQQSSTSSWKATSSGKGKSTKTVKPSPLLKEISSRLKLSRSRENSEKESLVEKRNSGSEKPAPFLKRLSGRIKNQISREDRAKSIRDQSCERLMSNKQPASVKLQQASNRFRRASLDLLEMRRDLMSSNQEALILDSVREKFAPASDPSDYLQRNRKLCNKASRKYYSPKHIPYPEDQSMSDSLSNRSHSSWSQRSNRSRSGRSRGNSLQGRNRSRSDRSRGNSLRFGNPKMKLHGRRSKHEVFKVAPPVGTPASTDSDSDASFFALEDKQGGRMTIGESPSKLSMKLQNGAYDVTGCEPSNFAISGVITPNTELASLQSENIQVMEQIQMVRTMLESLEKTNTEMKKKIQQHQLGKNEAVSKRLRNSLKRTKSNRILCSGESDDSSDVQVPIQTNLSKDSCQRSVGRSHSRNICFEMSKIHNNADSVPQSSTAQPENKQERESEGTKAGQKESSFNHQKPTLSEPKGSEKSQVSANLKEVAESRLDQNIPSPTETCPLVPESKQPDQSLKDTFPTKDNLTILSNNVLSSCLSPPNIESKNNLLPKIKPKDLVVGGLVPSKQQAYHKRDSIEETVAPTRVRADSIEDGKGSILRRVRNKSSRDGEKRRLTLELFEQEVLKTTSQKLERIRDHSRLLMEKMTQYQKVSNEDEMDAAKAGHIATQNTNDINNL